AARPSHDSGIPVTGRPGSGHRAQAGTGGPGRAASRRPGPARRRSERADFLGLRALLPPPGGVGDPLVLLQAAEAVSLDGRVMDEHVGGSVVRGDEAVALVGVEPLDGAFSHVLLLYRRSFGRHVHAPRVIATASLPGK